MVQREKIKSFRKEGHGGHFYGMPNMFDGNEPKDEYKRMI